MTLLEAPGGLSLNASCPPPPAPGPAIGDNGAPTGFQRVCLECGDDFESMKSFGAFCCPAHRLAWNNRRSKRGAELYDLFMALRFQRGLARTLALWKLACRLVSAFRDEDWRERDGRLSWRSPRTVIEERPWLTAKTLVRRRRRG
jgi:hypothetical protein